MEKMPAETMENFSIWAAIQGGKKVINILSLKEHVGELIKITVQKSNGKHPRTISVVANWDNFERIRMFIISQGCAISVSGLLDGIDFERVQERNLEAEYPTWDVLFNKKWKRFDFNITDTFNCLKPRYVSFNKENYESMKYHTSLLERFFRGDDARQKKEVSVRLEGIKNAILCETVSLVLSGKLEELEVKQ